VLREADEPDWNDPDKIYSEDVQREMQRIERNEATVMVFPVYWWSMPALLKGWIDRV
jgi:NAD(P)H dehydrogenase (quinone)